MDIKTKELLAFYPDAATRRSWTLPHRVCSLDVPSMDWHPPQSLGGDAFVGCCDLGLSWIGLDRDEVELIPMSNPESDCPENRFNDGKIGPDGRYWAGTMHDAEELATGSLYAFRADGSHTLLDTGYHVTNGPAFSPDGSVVYHTDSGRREIYAFEVAADATLTNKRVFARFAEVEGNPDGMTTDNDGNVWVAMWDGARLMGLTPDGTLLATIPMPTRRPTSCTFVQPDCTEMFVTSASVGVSGRDTLAGGLFRVRLG